LKELADTAKTSLFLGKNEVEADLAIGSYDKRRGVGELVILFKPLLEIACVKTISSLGLYNLLRTSSRYLFMGAMGMLL